MTPFGASIAFFLIWGVAIVTAVQVLRAYFRFVRAQERIALALEQFVARQ